MYSNSGNWSSRSTDCDFDRDATPPLHQDEHSQISVDQEGTASSTALPKDTPMEGALGTPDLVALLKFMQDQEAMRRREEEARRAVEKEHEAGN